MKAVAMKYKVADTLQPFRRLCEADKSGHEDFTYLTLVQFSGCSLLMENLTF